MAKSKHDADCLRRRDSERTRYLCTCDLTDEQLAEADKARSLSDQAERRRQIWLCEEHIEDPSAECSCGLVPYIRREEADAERDRLRAENTWLRNQMGDVRGMQSDGATAEEMDAALGRALSSDETNAPKET